LQLAADLFLCIGTAAVVLLHEQGLTVQIIGREVRSQVGTVAVDRAELHKAVREKRLLPLQDFFAGHERSGCFVHDMPRHRCVLRVDPQREIAQDGETDHEGKQHRL
jgi:hypothetical protein